MCVHYLAHDKWSINDLQDLYYWPPIMKVHTEPVGPESREGFPAWLRMERWLKWEEEKMWGFGIPVSLSLCLPGLCLKSHFKKEDVAHICSGILLSCKEKRNWVICSNMDAVKEVRKGKTNTTWYHLYVGSKIWPKWTYLWNRNRHTDIEIRLGVAKGKGGRERDGLGVWGW